MKLLAYAILICFAFAFSVAAQEKTPLTIERVLIIEVEDGKKLFLTAKDLEKFARREVRAKAHDEKDAVFSGYDLREILLAADARIGKDQLRGKEIGAYLVVEAKDGYRATFSITELSADFTDRVILLADTRDGKPLDEKNGKWQIIVPDDKKHGRWVRQVTALKLKKVQ